MERGRGGVMQDKSNIHDELVKALSNLLDQLEGVGIYIEGVDEGQWAGTEGLSFAEASAALAKAEEREDEERRELIDEQNLKYGGEPPMERED
jgi:hypothetical protein